MAAGARSRFVDVDGPAHVLDLGGPTTVPLLVGLHGLGGFHLNWMAVGPGLGRRCRVVALDLVGHGLTPVAGPNRRHGGPPSPGERLPAPLGGGPVILMGNSMGGLVAALQAAEEP